MILLSVMVIAHQGHILSLGSVLEYMFCRRKQFQFQVWRSQPAGQPAAGARDIDRRIGLWARDETLFNQINSRANVLKVHKKIPWM